MGPAGSDARHLPRSQADAGAPQPLEVDRFSYTAQMKPVNGPTEDRRLRNAFRYCYGPEEETDPCYARGGNIRRRRYTKAFLNGDIDDSADGQDFDRFWAEESFYEPDDGDPGGVGSHPKYAMNRVVKVTMEGYSDQAHYPPAATVSSDGVSWSGLGTNKWGDPIGYRTVRQVFDKTHDGQWLTSLVAERRATSSTPAGSTANFLRTTYGYDSQGRLGHERRRLNLTGDDDKDTVKALTYWADPSKPDSYGRIRTVALGTGDGKVDRKTGYLYQSQQVAQKWVLCDPNAQICEGWGSAPSGFDENKGQKQAQIAIDPDWRRPTAIRDANGDGISNISYDGLGRVTEIDPTWATRSKTWIEYPDLSTSLVKVMGRTSGGGLAQQVVARYEFDGLGRIAHAARRKEGTTTTGYVAGDFRHKGFFYDGVGTVWAESHWLDSLTGATTPPTSASSSDPDFEITNKIDPFGRVLNVLTSDGGAVANRYWGAEWNQSVLRTTSENTVQIWKRTDATGKLRDSWEQKKSDPWGWAPESADGNFAYINDRTHYIHSAYDYDVRGKLWRTTVDAEGADAQIRKTAYDALGNTLSETIPERDGPVTYSDHTAFGAPRQVLLPIAACDGTPLTLENVYDAAGREIKVDADTCGAPIPLRRLSYGIASPAIGKLVRAVQYNFMEETCGVADYGAGVDEPVDSLAVESEYTYAGNRAS